MKKNTIVSNKLYHGGLNMVIGGKNFLSLTEIETNFGLKTGSVLRLLKKHGVSYVSIGGNRLVEEIAFQSLLEKEQRLQAERKRKQSIRMKGKKIRKSSPGASPASSQTKM